MGTRNLVLLEGRLTRDPGSVYTAHAKEVLFFSVVTDPAYNGADPEFHQCLATSESLVKFICDYGQKGGRISLSGRLQYRPSTKDAYKSLAPPPMEAYIYVTEVVSLVKPLPK
jgi:single-stranded DNA-binding protein